jgi:hypothetical protein
MKPIAGSVVLLFLTACSSTEVGATSTQATTSTTATPTTTSATTTTTVETTTTIQNVFDLPEDFAPLEAQTTYWVDPDFDTSTPLRVFYTIPADGWSAWTGAIKVEEGPSADDRRIGVSIVTVDNLVADACSDHSEADPPVGPTVDDLATGLTNLSPFVVTSPPSDVTVYGFSGKHLQLAVPELRYEPRGDDFFWPDCNEGLLRTWIAPVLSFAFWGYSSPQQTEDFWILDVEGIRLMISATWSPDSPPQDVTEMQAVLDSIEIVP